MVSPEENYTITKYDICDTNLPTALANSSSVIAPRPSAQYRMQVSNMFTVNFMLCPSKANS